MMSGDRRALRKVNGEMARKYHDYADDIRPSIFVVLSIIALGFCYWIAGMVRRCLGLQ